MFIDYKLEGKYVTLRSVVESDAEFILSVRNDPRISKYLPPLNVTVEQQRQWISKQRADNDSYYFLLETPECEPIGTISIYDIAGDHGEGGRTCCIGEPFAAVEASLLFHDFVFDILGLKYTTGWVYENNKPVIALNNAFGITWGDRKVDKNGEPYLECQMHDELYKKNRDKILRKLRIKK
jgi:RimJ/RimL family protein N-acetyltransferase